MPPGYLPGGRMHGSWLLQYPATPVDAVVIVGSVAPESGSFAYESGVARPESGSETRGRKCSSGFGLILPVVPAAASPARRATAPLVMFMLKLALIALREPLLLSASVH